MHNFQHDEGGNYMAETETCKKNPYNGYIVYNQPKPYFFKKLLQSHFWIDFNKFYTKTFRIIYILTVYMSGFYLYII